jgi:hypothetical protein
MASNCRTIGEYWIGMNLEERGRGLAETLTLAFAHMDRGKKQKSSVVPAEI